MASIAENLQSIVDIKKDLREEKQIDYGTPFKDYSGILIASAASPVIIVPFMTSFYKKIVALPINYSVENEDYYTCGGFNDALANGLTTALEGIKTHGGINFFLDIAREPPIPILRFGDFSFEDGLVDFKKIDTSTLDVFNEMFANCTSLTTIPQLDTHNGMFFNEMFANCTSLTTIPQLDTHNGMFFNEMFANCTSLTTIPQLDTHNGMFFNEMFANCTSLTTIPQLDTHNGMVFDDMFYKCSSLTNIPELDASSAISILDPFNGCASGSKLYFGGFKNVKNIKIQLSTTMDDTASVIFTSKSITDIFNNLGNNYDGGSTTTGTICISKLQTITSEQKAIATNKGWVISTQ